MVATLAGAVVRPASATYVVLRSMSYIGHGLSHAIFGGFAASSAAVGVNVVPRRRPVGRRCRPGPSGAVTKSAGIIGSATR